MRGRVCSPKSLSRLIPVVAVVGLLVPLTAACGRGPAPDAHAQGFDNAGGAKVDPSADRVSRGKYLVAAGDCVACHTPMKMGPKGPEPDMARYLSGHPEDLVMPPAPKPEGPWIWHGAATNTAFAGPWGVSYAINLTSDADTGLGSWTEDVFVTAIRTGRHLGVGRPIMPPMPWQAYAHLTDEDLKAMFAYLKTVPAQKNRVPDAVVAPPPQATN